MGVLALLRCIPIIAFLMNPSEHDKEQTCASPNSHKQLELLAKNSEYIIYGNVTLIYKKNEYLSNANKLVINHLSQLSSGLGFK